MFKKMLVLAMMVELMAGKAAALHGFVQDATPFRFTEDDTAIDFCGKLLEAGIYHLQTRALCLIFCVTFVIIFSSFLY